MSNPSAESKPRPARRRWLQFGLSTLLLAVLLFSLAGAWFHRERERIHARRAIASEFLLEAGNPQPAWHRRLFGPDDLGAARAITFDPEEHGHKWNQFGDAEAAYLRGLGALESLSLYGKVELSDRGLEEIAALSNLKTLRIDAALTDDQMQILVSRLTKLQHLNFDGRKITARGLALLSSLTDLRAPYLHGYRYTDDDLKYLAPCRELRELSLDYTLVTGTGFVHLAGLKKLEKLRLSRCQLRGDGFEHLAGLTNLQELTFWHSHVPGHAFRHLAGLTNLKQLDVSFTGFNDESVPHLVGMTKLENLNLQYSRVTGAGFEVFQNLPALKWVNVNNTRFTGRGLRYLPHSKHRPHALNLERCPLVDEALAELSLQPQIVELDLRETPISDAGLRHVAQMKSLARVNLDKCPNITAEGLKAFQGHPTLESLSVRECRGIGPGLMHLAGLKLKYLNAERVDLSDDDLQVIDQLPALAHLWIHFNPRVTDRSLALFGAVPKLRNINALGSGISKTGMAEFEKTHGFSFRH